MRRNELPGGSMSEPIPPAKSSVENIKQLMDLLRPVVDDASKLT